MLLYFSIFLLLFFNLIGAILIKYSAQFHSNFRYLCLFFASLACVYALRALLWLIIGKRYQLSFVYPFLGINYILSWFVGITLFNEPVVLKRFVGAITILLGVTILTFSKHRHEKSDVSEIKQ